MNLDQLAYLAFESGSILCFSSWTRRQVIVRSSLNMFLTSIYLGLSVLVEELLLAVQR